MNSKSLHLLYDTEAHNAMHMYKLKAIKAFLEQLSYSLSE